MAKRPEFKESKYPDAKGKFKELSCEKLARYMISSRKGNKRAIIGSLNSSTYSTERKTLRTQKKWFALETG